MSTSVRAASMITYEVVQTSKVLDAPQWKLYDHLFKHGPCTGSEINEKLKTGKRDVKYHLVVRDLIDAGCVSEVGLKPNASGTKNERLFDVTNKLPDEVKLAVQKARRIGKRPGRADMKQAIEELFAVCKELRDTHKRTFSPQFLAMCHWLKTLVPPPKTSPG